jgi:hypothetical protein
MKTVTEIKSYIDELQSELLTAEEWTKSAHDRYLKDKKYWGTADHAEVEYANSVVSELKGRINTLNWVLENNNI